MSSDSRLSCKVYLEKATQTDAYMRFPEPAFGQSRSNCLLDIPRQNGTDKALESSGCAYSRPVSPFPPIAKRQYNLGHGHGLLSGNKTQARVISFPEPILQPTHRISLEQKPRVVSMPDGDTQSTWLDGQNTINTQSLTTGKAMPSRIGRPYPLDLPQTPSPPSSPDSVVIIGNETHVPGSILKHYEEENGWISWAHSPPRPIPALHGPSSLPYARCPSGAEGTVVEGDDLCQKVWGLGPDDAQGQARLKPPQSPPKAIQRLEAIAEIAQPCVPVRPDTIIDLSRPFTFHPNRHSNQIHIGLEKDLQHRPVFPVEFSRGLAGNNRKSDVVDLPRKLIQPPIEQNSRSQPTAGLGLNWQTFIRPSDYNLGQSQDAHRSVLNSAAPAFIPTNSSHHVANFNAYTQVPNDNSPPGSQQATNFGTVPAYPPTQDLPATPSTTSTYWSPAFSSTNGAFEAYEPGIYSPQMELDGYSAHLMALMQRLKAQERFDQLQDHSNTTSTRLPHQNIPSVVDSRKDHMKPSHPALSYSNVSSANKLVPATESNAGLKQESDLPLEGRRPLSYQQPRSIPLARLIQRRLSSVTEEDITNFTNRLTGVSEPCSRVASLSGSDQSEAESQPPLKSITQRSGYQRDEHLVGLQTLSNDRVTVHQSGGDDGQGVNLDKENQHGNAEDRQSRRSAQKQRYGNIAIHSKGNNRA